jgi:hypothetical protein
VLELALDRLRDLVRRIDPELRPDRDVDLGAQLMAQASCPNLGDASHAVHVSGNRVDLIDHLRLGAVEAIAHPKQMCSPPTRLLCGNDHNSVLKPDI